MVSLQWSCHLRIYTTVAETQKDMITTSLRIAQKNFDDILQEHKKCEENLSENVKKLEELSREKSFATTRKNEAEVEYFRFDNIYFTGNWR